MNAGKIFYRMAADWTPVVGDWTGDGIDPWGCIGTECSSSGTATPSTKNVCYHSNKRPDIPSFDNSYIIRRRVIYRHI